MGKVPGGEEGEGEGREGRKRRGGGEKYYPHKAKFLEFLEVS